MKHIRLIRMTLNNFKGMSFVLDAQGEDTDVYGRNATGKTTLADAFAWLLFDKDSLGRSDFEIKNLDSQGEAEHGLQHLVQGEINIDGVVITLKKVYYEKWENKRGSAQATYSGNTTDFYINGVPVKQKDYVATVAERIGEEGTIKLLTTPTAFNTLHWTKRRALLLEVCGDMTDDDVIASDPDLAPLTDLLAPYRTSKAPFEDLKKVIVSRKSEINKDLDRIPVRIDEQKRMMPDVAGLNRDGLYENVVQLETALADAKMRLQGVDNGGAIAELAKELQGVKYDIGQAENSYYLEGMKKVRELGRAITEIQDSVTDVEKKSESVKNNLRFKKELLGTIDKKLERLRAQFMEVDGEIFQDTTEDTCAACGQPLPADRVEDARDKARAAFNRSKAERLDDVDRNGTAIKGERENIILEIEKLEGQLSQLEDPDRTELDALIEERDALKARAEDYSYVPGRAELFERQERIEAAIKTARESVSVDRDAISREIEGLEVQLREARDNADKFRRREQGTARIEQLKGEEKTLTTEFEKLEGQLFLCELFTRAKTKLLTEKVNERFQFVRFKLFNVLVNGGLEDCCEATVNGIPYNDGLNSAGKINAGLDVCRTLSRHYGLVAPIFVDNAESVCQLIHMDAQVVRLVVSEADKALRVEAARDRRAA